MRRTLLNAAALTAALVVGVAGCARAANTPAAAVTWPVEANGPLCQLLNYDRVEAATGTAFDTAGGARKDDTITCALTQSDHNYPDLSLSVAPFVGDAVIFQASVVPSGGVLVKGLGVTAYTAALPAASGSGPAVEIGWLTDGGHLMIVHYTSVAGTSAADIATMTAGLLGLSKDIDKAFPQA